jgi:hypothetical protein
MLSPAQFQCATYNYIRIFQWTAQTFTCLRNLNNVKHKGKHFTIMLEVNCPCHEGTMVR